MEHRTLGRTDQDVSVVGLGTWQLGADWGEVSEEDALGVLEASAEAGVTFFDTADVYGDGRSEQLLGQFLRSHPDSGVFVATKMGRRMDQTSANYSLAHFREWTDRSRRNLGLDTLPLVQLHCPPSEVIDDDATWAALDTLVEEGAIAAYGVSVETCDQALSAIARPSSPPCRSSSTRSASSHSTGCSRPQPRPASGSSRGCRSPRGCCPGSTPGRRRSPRTTTAASTATAAPSTWARPSRASTTRPASWLRPSSRSSSAARHPRDVTPAQAAIAWLWQQPGVTTVIPGARNVDQARSNAGAGLVPALGPRVRGRRTPHLRRAPAREHPPALVSPAAATRARRRAPTLE